MDSPYWKGPLPGVDVQRRLPVENIPGASRTAFRGRPKSVRLQPGIRVRLQPGMVFGISPESCSASARNAVRLAPEYAPGAEIFTDALKSYEGLNPEFVHKVVDHAVEYVKGHVHTNGMENFWSLLKRTLNGTYV